MVDGCFSSLNALARSSGLILLPKYPLIDIKWSVGKKTRLTPGGVFRDGVVVKGFYKC